MENEQELNFDPSICYRNFIIGVARHLNSIENTVKSLRKHNDPKRGMGLVYKANTLEESVSNLRLSFSWQKDACFYYFGTDDIAEIAAQKVQRDETMSLLHDYDSH